MSDTDDRSFTEILSEKSMVGRAERFANGEPFRSLSTASDDVLADRLSRWMTTLTAFGFPEPPDPTPSMVSRSDAVAARAEWVAMHWPLTLPQAPVLLGLGEPGDEFTTDMLRTVCRDVLSAVHGDPR